MKLLTEIQTTAWDISYADKMRSQAIESLEQGNILFFPALPFTLLPNEKKFLSSHYANPVVKNISFNSHNNSLRGMICSEAESLELKQMIERFAYCANKLVRELLLPYANLIKIGRTSFRPVEISGRVSSYRKDDTRLHVDAFPATPNQGQRILRVFTNINPDGKDRVWRVGEPFAQVAEKFLPEIRHPWIGSATLLKLLKITKGYRTPYDHIMLQIHDKMKRDLNYQATVTQCEIYFPPGSSWIVQTDHVSHAAMAGQHVLEQTFYLPVMAMNNPSLSPLRTLEKLMGKRLV